MRIGDPFTDPVVELTGPGVAKLENDNGHEIGLVTGLDFGLFGAEAAWTGHGFYEGRELWGTKGEMWFEQLYRTTSPIDSLTANLFGMHLYAADATGGPGADSYAGFAIDIWLTPYNPNGPGPGFDDIIPNNYLFARVVAVVRKSQGERTYTFIGPECEV